MIWRFKLTASFDGQKGDPMTEVLARSKTFEFSADAEEGDMESMLHELANKMLIACAATEGKEHGIRSDIQSGLKRGL